MIVKALVSYDGFNYAGWQKQENALGIQQVIEEALYKITKENVDVVASGRTDAGVHAFGQVFHFETSKNVPAIQYERALNALLPKDIRILKTEEMPDDFHARFSAVGKRYDYYCSYDIKNPFNYKYRNLLTKKLDIETMKNASKVFLGSHDFTSFASSKIDPRKPRVKKISNIEIKNAENGVTRFYALLFLKLIFYSAVNSKSPLILTKSLIIGAGNFGPIPKSDLFKVP